MTKKSFLCSVVSLSFCIGSGLAAIFDIPGNRNAQECQGTLRVQSGGREYLFNSTQLELPGGGLRMVAGRDEVKLDGCGCYLLFQRGRRAGRAYLVNRPGYHYYALHRIGSVTKEDCSRLVEYRPAEVGIISVITLLSVSVLSVMVVISIKKCGKRHYSPVSSPDTESGA